MMRFSVLSLCVALSGCLGAGPTLEQSAAIQAVNAENKSLLAAHKITYVEAEKRTDAQIENSMGQSLSDQDRLLMAYKLALASQIDSGQITEEVANYQFAQHVNDIKSANRERLAASIREFGNGLQRAAENNRPVMCNSNTFGSINQNTYNSSTNTTCR